MSEKQVFVKKESVGEFGKKPSERTAEELINYGIINLDKPKGPTSHQCSAYVKNILDISKAGHSGTLDPQVTGVQPIALGNATKIAEYLLNAPKEYVCLMHLHKEVDEKTINETFKLFVGKIRQLPPIKSAVKRVERVREIYELEVIEIKGKDVLFRVKCQAGTYIRKLCLHAQTEILTKEGLMSASNFYSNHPTIYSYNNGKIIRKNPSATQKIISPPKLIKITMSSGINVIITQDHELLTSKKEKYEMVEAQVLKQGDYLVKSLIFPDDSRDLVISDLLDDSYYIQQEEIKRKCKQAFLSKYGSIREMHRKLKLDRKVFLSKSNNAITIKHLKLAGIYESIKKNIHTFKTQKGNVITIKNLNEDFFYLLGLIASDGNNTKEKKTARYTRIKFHNNEEVIINKFLKTYKKLFPTVPISKKKMTPKLWQLDTANSLLATIAASLGVKSPQKNSDLLPIVNIKPLFISTFLRGYFDGDGSAYYKKRLNSTTHDSSIKFHTISEVDANRIHKMLLKLNIPNKIFFRKIVKTPSSTITSSKGYHQMYDVSVESIPAKREFIKKIGSNHPFKINKFKQILSITNNGEIHDHYLIGLHFKKEIRKNKTQLQKMSGNLYRILNTKIPMTRGFYRKASRIVKLPKLDEFIIEKIKGIEIIKGTDYVYDMTVPETHNFLIETGFVSSNCSDFGLKIGGAHMAQLRRTMAGPFDEDNKLITLNDLQDAYHYFTTEDNDKFLSYCLQPIENSLTYITKCWILDSSIESLIHGRDLGIPGISKLENFKKNETVAIMTLKDELVAIGTSQMSAVEINCNEKGIAINVKKVFMK